MTVIVRLNNASGTEWTLKATSWTDTKDHLIVWAESGKEWHFPLVNVLWWTVEPKAQP